MDREGTKPCSGDKVALLKQLRHANGVTVAFEEERKEGDEPKEEQEHIIARVYGGFHLHHLLTPYFSLSKANVALSGFTHL